MRLKNEKSCSYKIANHLSQPMMQKTTLALLLLVALSVTTQVQAQENLQLLNFYAYYSDAPNTLYHQICQQAFQQLDQRKEAIARLHTQADWEQRQAEVRSRLQRLIGPFPEKNPLNPQITGTLQKDGYRVEKVVFESQPQFYVTAALFVPDGLAQPGLVKPGLAKPGPAILFASGHTADGFRSATYQTMILNYVQKGFVVLAFDPVGQGERWQYTDEETEIINGSTDEHSYVGAQCFLNGSSLARHMIWDGIRAVDYLLTRPEVDPARIGMTGRSGGGTQTALVAAMDERIRATAPEAYITDLELLLKTRGPQDAEQNIYHGIAAGLNHADLLEVRAPKPTLIVSTTRDYFSIQGARDAYQEVQASYRAFGQEGNISMAEDDSVHASTTKNREATYAFFRKHLQNPGSAHDEPVDLLTAEELRVTATGQVATSLGGETVFSLNKKLTDSLRSKQSASFAPARVVQAARDLSGYQAPPPFYGKALFAGRYTRAGYTIEKYLLEGKDHVNPYLYFRPDSATQKPLILYLHPDGKAAGAAPGGEIEQLVRRGFNVLAPDLLGTGELGNGYQRGDSYIDSVSYNQWFASVLTDHSLVGWQATDIVKLVRYLQRQEEPPPIYAVAHSTLTPALLHAAAFEPLITRVALVEPLVSYRALTEHKYYQPKWIPASVAGALTAYDLPALAATLVPRKLTLIDVQDHRGEAMPTDVVRGAWAATQREYADGGSFVVVQRVGGASVAEALAGWLE